MVGKPGPPKAPYQLIMSATAPTTGFIRYNLQVEVEKQPTINTNPQEATYTIRPGETITGLDGVQIIAPKVWRAESGHSAEITISRVDPAKFPQALPKNLNQIASSFYKIESTVAPIFSASTDFSIRVPVAYSNPFNIMPMKLIWFTTDNDDPEGNDTQGWVEDENAVISGQYITYSRSFIEDFTVGAVSTLKPRRRIPPEEGNSVIAQY